MLKILLPILLIAGANAANGAPASTYAVDLNVVRFADSQWTPVQIEEQIQTARAVFAQCDLDLGDVRVYSVQSKIPSANLKKFKFDQPDSIAKLAEEVKALPRPLVFFIQSIDSTDGESTPFSRAAFENAKYPEALLDTVWMPWLVSTEAFRKEEAAYSVFPHELTHVLTRDGDHNNDAVPNLMTVSMRRNNFLTPEQCRSIVQSPLVRERRHAPAMAQLHGV
jgi:hypothetical protein